MGLWISKRRWSLSALAVGLMLRGLFVWRHAAFDGDTLVYGDLARNMIAHHVYGLTENVVRPTLIRLPGYPLFLAGCFWLFGTARYVAVVWVQVVVGLATCGMLGRLAGRMFGERVGIWTLWLACLCPFTANYDAVPLTECLSLFCVVAVFFAMERWVAALRRGGEGFGWVLGIGAGLSYAVLLRPEQGLLAAAVVPVMMVVGLRVIHDEEWMEKLRPALMAAMIVVLPLALWGARNWRVFHVVQPLAPKYANDPGEYVSYGFSAWYRTWGTEYWSTANTYWLYDGGVLSMEDLPKRAVDPGTAAAYAAYNEVRTGTPEVDARFARLAAIRLKAHPFRTRVLMPLGREVDMWLRPRTEFMKLPLAWWRVGEHPWGSLACLLYAVLDWVLLGLAWKGLRRVRWDGVMVGMMVFVGLRCALLLTLDNAEPRYTLECFPVVILLAGVGCAGGEAKVEVAES